VTQQAARKNGESVPLALQYFCGVAMTYVGARHTTATKIAAATDFLNLENSAGGFFSSGESQSLSRLGLRLADCLRLG
jgi:hypothetical protein